MPTYDYRCEACGHGWELFQSMSAAPVRVCPACGKKKAERLIGMGAAIVFKGSGFYQTDYRSEGYKKAAEADQKASASDGGAGNEAAAKVDPASKADPASKPEPPASAVKPGPASKPEVKVKEASDSSSAARTSPPASRSSASRREPKRSSPARGGKK